MRARKLILTRQIGVRLPPATLQWLEAKADQECLPPSTLVWQWIQEHARRDLGQKEDAQGAGHAG